MRPLYPDGTAPDFERVAQRMSHRLERAERALRAHQVVTAEGGPLALATSSAAVATLPPVLVLEPSVAVVTFSAVISATGPALVQLQGHLEGAEISQLYAKASPSGAGDWSTTLSATWPLVWLPGSYNLQVRAFASTDLTGATVDSISLVAVLQPHSVETVR